VLGKRWAAVTAGLKEQSRLLDLLERRSERLETILMVREPSSTAAADAYDGLRRQVVAAVGERQTHLAQLVQMDAAVAHGADGEVLGRMLDGWFEEADLVRRTDASGAQVESLFELVEDGDGPLEVIEPAYVDRRSGRVVRLGRARRVPSRGQPADAWERGARGPADGSTGRRADQSEEPSL
jgi:hypothetical protein